jgi:signal transduction histidine kinase
MRPLDFVRSTTFRWTVAVAGMFAVFLVALFAFMYWRTEQFLLSRTDAVIAMQTQVFLSAPSDRRLDMLDRLPQHDPLNVEFAGLFTPQGKRIAGNIEIMPADLEIGAPAQQSLSTEVEAMRGIARRLPDGNVVVVGRKMIDIAKIVEQTLAMGLLPALFLSITGAAILSIRAQRRVEEVNERVQRIVAGDLRQRLPTRGSDDSFDKLASIVNGMLANIESLMQEIAGVGDDIAHDLRTPLTRVRMRLERGRAHARTLEQLGGVVDQAIAGLDQSLAMITALLRIAEIEHARRLDCFSRVSLAPLLREVGDIYEPIAEDKGVTLQVEAEREAVVHGDRDLLFEAVANLVDNAVKFTPEGGRIELGLVHRDGETAIQVRDTGPGISEEESKAVTKRFYRSDKSRSSHGLGLGLSIVVAIVKLHNFRFTVAPGRGCAVEIACPPQPR